MSFQTRGLSNNFEVSNDKYFTQAHKRTYILTNTKPSIMKSATYSNQSNFNSTVSNSTFLNKNTIVFLVGAWISFLTLLMMAI